MAVRFDAAADRLLRTASLPAVGGPFSRLAWYYFTSVGIDQAFDSLNNNNVDTRQVSYLSAANVLSMYNNNDAFTGSTLVANTWYHIAVTRASSTSFTMYLNGVSDVTAGTAGPGSTVTRVEHGGEFTTNQNPMSGRVAAIKWYNASLTAAEILNEMRFYRPLRTANLNLWAPCLHGTQRNLDYSGNGRDFTASGTLTDEDGPPIAWGPRKSFKRAIAAAAPLNLGAFQPDEVFIRQGHRALAV